MDTITRVCVAGEVLDVAVSTPDDETRSPVKLWSAVTPPQLGMPLFPGPIPSGPILVAEETLPAGLNRRTWWRL